KMREVEDANKIRLAALQKLQEDITGAVLALRESIGKDVATDLEKQISSLSLVAIDLSRKKIDERYAAAVKDNQVALDIERTKTFKSMEAFLATMPFPLLDKAISLRSVSGAYAANVRYDCAKNIQYEFSLDCKRSSVLNKGYILTSPEGEIKIPVAMGKSFFKKEPVPDYEGLERYVLTIAEATDPHLASTYISADKPSSVTIINSKRDAHASMTVEYVSAGAKTSITSEPALNKFLNSEQIEKASEALWRSILELESFKIDLVKLTSDGRAVFDAGKFDAGQFLARAWTIIEPEIEATVRQGIPAGEGDAASPGQESALDEAFVRQKISTLGDAGAPILASLKLS
ncbi:MAG: hypothetical protein OK474_12025, partial [Thaumarchaeota archaeon]|nr:hypothetical protein [Nitrososphaerota archaeon]